MQKMLLFCPSNWLHFHGHARGLHQSGTRIHQVAFCTQTFGNGKSYTQFYRFISYGTNMKMYGSDSRNSCRDSDAAEHN